MKFIFSTKTYSFSGKFICFLKNGKKFQQRSKVLKRFIKNVFIKFVNPLHLFVCSKSIYEFSISIYGDFIIISKRNRFLLNVDCSFIFCFSFIGFSIFMKWNNWLLFGNEYDLAEPLSSDRCCIWLSYILL